jgi:hypothetical protein
MFKVALMLALLLSWSGTHACDWRNDGDCCDADSDCVAHIGYCSVQPLNKEASRELHKKALPSCSALTDQELKVMARSMQVKCDDHVCENVEDLKK